MEIFRFENVTFTYPKRVSPALCNVSFDIRSGEFVTVCGKSGSGKSTLLKLLKPSVSPGGSMSGEIFFDGSPLHNLTPREDAAEIGFVLQDPEKQIVTDKVWHELAFGLENLGLPQNEIRARVAETAAFFGIDEWFYKSVSELSGGEKQLLNLASVMVLHPKVLLLDEPTSRLDPIATSNFLSVLSKINRELGTTVIICEHKLDEIMPFSDRVLVLDRAEISIFSSPRDVAESLCKSGSNMAYAMPVPARVHAALSSSLPCPVSIREGRNFLDDISREVVPDPELVPEDKDISFSENILELSNVYFRYGKSSPDVLKDLSLNVKKGEILAIVGGNGAGKSTLLSVMGGLYRPHHGKVKQFGKASLLPQDPTALFTHDELSNDLKCVSRNYMEAALFCDIESLLSYHPLDLSGGEIERAALAKVILTDADILLLDEPTKGLDAHFKKSFGALLKQLKAAGKSIVFISHDTDFCAEFSDRVLFMFDGAISSDAPPRKFFSQNSFYTTAASRMARFLIPRAVLCEDIAAAFGKQLCSTASSDTQNPVYKNPTPKAPKKAVPKKSKLTKSGIIATFFSIVAAVATVLFGLYALDDKKYYTISLLLIIEAMLPFFINFESRRATSRELSLVSVMTALAVIGRAAFYMVPQFKPLVAIVIISGIALGTESGFLVGALSGFVSNMFFGQGPWTPWQMFTLGLCGALAGLIFREGGLPRSRIAVSVFGGLSVLIIYSVIMNTASLLMWQPYPTSEMIVLSIIQGIPFDFIHAVGTVVFLFLLSVPAIKKISRVLHKYSTQNSR